MVAVIDRELPSSEAADLLDLVRDLVQRELAPRADKAEATGTFPREVFAELGELGLLSLPYPERFGGGDQPATVYLQVLEELARGWATVALGVSVHVLACSGVAEFGTAEQQEAFLPEMLGGSTLGAYCLSEAHAGSDAGAMRTRAVADGDEYVITGDKAWITHGPVADFYLLAARTGDDRSHGISTFLLPHGHPGLTAGTPERKMGFRGVGDQRDPVRRGRGRHPTVGSATRARASGSLGRARSGRLGISACAVGLAQAALDVAAAYAAQRVAFGRLIDDFQGVSFLFADAAPRSSRRASCICTPRAARTPASRSRRRLRWQS